MSLIFKIATGLLDVPSAGIPQTNHPIINEVGDGEKSRLIEPEFVNDAEQNPLRNENSSKEEEYFSYLYKLNDDLNYKSITDIQNTFRKRNFDMSEILSKIAQSTWTDPDGWHKYYPNEKIGLEVKNFWLQHLPNGYNKNVWGFAKYVNDNQLQQAHIRDVFTAILNTKEAEKYTRPGVLDQIKSVDNAVAKNLPEIVADFEKTYEKIYNTQMPDSTVEQMAKVLKAEILKLETEAPQLFAKLIEADSSGELLYPIFKNQAQPIISGIYTYLEDTFLTKNSETKQAVDKQISFLKEALKKKAQKVDSSPFVDFYNLSNPNTNKTTTWVDIFLSNELLNKFKKAYQDKNITLNDFDKIKATASILDISNQNMKRFVGEGELSLKEKKYSIQLDLEDDFSKIIDEDSVILNINYNIIDSNLTTQIPLSLNFDIAKYKIDNKEADGSVANSTTNVNNQNTNDATPKESQYLLSRYYPKSEGSLVQRISEAWINFAPKYNYQSTLQGYIKFISDKNLGNKSIEQIITYLNSGPYNQTTETDSGQQIATNQTQNYTPTNIRGRVEPDNSTVNVQTTETYSAQPNAQSVPQTQQRARLTQEQAEARIIYNSLLTLVQNNNYKQKFNQIRFGAGDATKQRLQFLFKSGKKLEQIAQEVQKNLPYNLNKSHVGEDREDFGLIIGQGLILLIDGVKRITQLLKGNEQEENKQQRQQTQKEKQEDKQNKKRESEY